MMRTHTLLLVAGLVTLLLALGAGSEAPLAGHEGDYNGAVVPRLEAHGESICASGCAASRHPTPRLSSARFHQLLKDYSEQPMSSQSPALEELLFFGPQTAYLLADLEKTPLDQERLSFLRRELEREQVVVEFRIIDEEGQVRVGLPPTTVALDRRYVFEPLHTTDFQPPEASGTVKRVGLHHLWQRI